jgi:methionyl-tRNA formyltransferase
VRLFIAGQKAFGAAVLEVALARGHEVVGVSSPPLAAGCTTTGEPLPDRLRDAAARAGVPWMPSGTLSAESLPPRVDLIVAAHSHDFIGRRTRLRAERGAIGYHPSLLPRHRGRDAIRWAIHMGERVTGGSIYRLTDNVDSGPVIAQEHVFIRPGDTAEELWRRELFELGVRLFDRVLTSGWRIEDEVPQDEALATWEPSWERAPMRRPDLLLIGDGRGAGDAATHHRRPEE